MNDTIASASSLFDVYSTICHHVEIPENKLQDYLPHIKPQALRKALNELHSLHAIEHLQGNYNAVNPIAAKISCNEKILGQIDILQTLLTHRTRKLKELETAFYNHAPGTEHSILPLDHESVQKIICELLSTDCTDIRLMLSSSFWQEYHDINFEKLEAILQRGANVSCIIPQEISTDSSYTAQLSALKKLGVQLKVLEACHHTLLIFGVHTAIVPSETEHSLQLVKDTHLIQILTDQYTALWDAAQPLSFKVRSQLCSHPLNLTKTEEEIIRGLYNGLTHQEIASEHDKSLRSVQRNTQALMKKFEAENQFCFGYAVAQLGLQFAPVEAEEEAG